MARRNVKVKKSVAAAPAWQLPSTNFTPAKMSMTVVHPRPDGETNTWARHRKAYPDGVAQYRIPVSVQGGAYPFHYELTSAPAGMTIGQDWDDTDYGIVTWTPSVASGPHTVTCLVTDQDGSTVTAEWTVTATTTGFIFVDPSVGTSGSGTKASPFKLWSDFTGGTREDATHTGKIVYLRGGTHAVVGPEPNGNLQVEQNYKPVVYLGYTGESVVLDFSGSVILVGAGQHDFYAADFSCIDSRTDVNDSRCFFFTANNVGNRTTFLDVSFSNITRGLVGSDNPGAIIFFNPGATLRQYFTMWGCHIEDHSSVLIDCYGIRYGVVEGNTIGARKTGDFPEQALLLKSDLQDFSVRRNSHTAGSVFGYGLVHFLLQAQNNGNNNLEACYNLGLTSASEGQGIVACWTEAEGFNSSPNIYIYRNTLRRNINGLSAFAYTTTVEKNVIENASDVIFASSGAMTVIENDNLNTTGLIDASGNLLNSANVGKYGHVISGAA